MLRAVRAFCAIGAMAGVVLCYNLLAQEAARLGPVMIRGAAGIIGPLVVVISATGLLATSRSPQFLVRAGAGSACAAVVLAPLALWGFAGEPFLQFVMELAAAVLFAAGVSMAIAGRDRGRRESLAKGSGD
jgi:hypothetical protein